MSELSVRLLFASRDRRLRGFDLRVFTLLHTWLNDTDFLPVRLDALANDLHNDPSAPPLPPPRDMVHNVARTMRRLVEIGYLETGPTRRGRRRTPLKTYRFNKTLPRIVTGATKAAA
jgi:hypothetical protein